MSVLPSRDRRVARLSALAAAGCFALAWLLGHATPQRALQGYLALWLWVLALPLGSLAMLAIHTLTGGRWGVMLQPLWLKCTRLLPLTGVLWLPLLVAAPVVFPWAATADASVPRWYLNIPFLSIRAGTCFVLWCVIGWRQRRTLAVSLGRRPTLAEQGYAGASLLVLLLTLSVTAVDWIMSLVPAWHSTAIGLLLMTSYLVVALAAAVAWWSMSAPGRIANDDEGLQQRRDLGNLLLAGVLGWAYLAFMDFLTAWIADQPAETVWYLPRMHWPWAVLPVMLLALQLALPLVLLLPRWGKQRLQVLGPVAWLVLAMQGVNMVWLTLPGWRDADRPWAWSDPFVALAMALALLAAGHRLRHRAYTGEQS